MKITFTPAREDNPITLARDGDALIIDGLRFDFADLPEGADLPAEAVQTPYITGTVTRRDGQLSLKVRLPHGKNAPHEAKFPDPITADADGPIALPAFDVITDEDGNEQEIHGTAPSVTSDGLIDWSQMVTAEDKAQEAAIARADAIKAECRDRILAVAPEQAQANLAQSMVAYTAEAMRSGSEEDAEALSGLTNGDFAVAKSAVSWRKEMVTACRTAILSGADPIWPDAPEGVAKLMGRM